MLACFPVLGTLNVWYNAEHYEVAFGGTSGPFQLAWPAILAVSAWLAVSSNPTDHWIGWVVIWLGNLLISLTVLPTLGQA